MEREIKKRFKRYDTECVSEMSRLYTALSFGEEVDPELIAWRDELLRAVKKLQDAESERRAKLEGLDLASVAKVMNAAKQGAEFGYNQGKR